MAGVLRAFTLAILGHPSGHITNMTTKYLDLNKMENKKICESCIRGKQRQKKRHERGRVQS